MKIMDVFVTGATGYIGRRLVAALLGRGHRVRALARHAAATRVPAGAAGIVGDALDADSFVSAIAPGSTLVHLVGTPHPNPAKAAQFESVDLASIRASVAAAARADVAHLVYVSVAHPAPVMRDYVAARVKGEAAIAASRLAASILRPWYVVGPGHWWPIVLVPFYAIGEWIPATREQAQRLGLVTLGQMVRALVAAVETPPARGARRILDVPAIRAARLPTPGEQRTA